MSSVQAAVVPDITPAFITINTGLAPVSSLQMAPATFLLLHICALGLARRWRAACPGVVAVSWPGPDPASWPRRPDPGPGATRTPPPAPTPVSLLKSVPESARVYSARQYQAPRSYGEGWTLIQGFTMTSSSVKFSVRRSWQFLSVLFLLFVNVSIHTFFSFFPRSGESFIILILVNTLHFIPRCMDIYFV